MNIVIRKMNENDYEPLCRLLSDDRVMEHLEPPFSDKRTKQFMEGNGLSEPARIFSVDKDNEFIGYVIYHPYDDDSMEIGWVLSPEYWGRGIATTLTEMLVQQAREEGKKAIIECSPKQKATKCIAEKCGFQYQGKADGLDIYTRALNERDRYAERELKRSTNLFGLSVERLSDHYLVRELTRFWI